MDKELSVTGLQEQLRKNQDTMYIVGTGTILLSIWGVFKAIAFTILTKSGIEKLVGHLPETIPLRFLLIYAWISLLLDLLLRIVVGVCARQESRGRRHSPVYIVFSAFLSLTYLFSAVHRVKELIDNRVFDEDQIIMILIDATSMIVLMELVLSAVRVRRLTSLLGKDVDLPPVPDACPDSPHDPDTGFFTAPADLNNGSEFESDPDHRFGSSADPDSG